MITVHLVVLFFKVWCGRCRKGSDISELQMLIKHLFLEIQLLLPTL